MVVFQFVADTLGVTVDQAVFFITQIISLPIAVFFRKLLSPVHTSCTTRHIFGAAVGLTLLYWCYGWYLLHMVAQCVGVYAIMMLLPQHINYKIAFVYAMGYLTYVQITRIRGIPDFASPVMFSTTKLTGLAFSIHDGVHKKKETLSPYQLKYALRKYPTLIEVLGYVFHFSGLICGPTFFFRDYTEFISGENYLCKDREITQNNNSNGKDHCKKTDIADMYRKISPTNEVLMKFSTSVLMAAIHLLMSSRFPVELNGESSFINSHGFLYRFMYITLSMIFVRYRYYFVWMMGETIQNAAGLGLHFFNGNPQWDLTPNVRVWNIDKATSLKVMTDNWNISSGKWLRLVCYERSGRYRLAWTFLLSAFWHGVEPGFYVTFGSLVLVAMAGRKMRKHLRPYFVDTEWKMHYDIFTGISAYFAMCYSMGGFHLLHWEETYRFYTYSMYWWMHLLLVFMIIVPIPFKKTKEKEKLK